MHKILRMNMLCGYVFLKVWESRERMPEIRSFKNYLFIVPRNHVLNTLEKAS
ncbi:MAG: hypothetical protein JNL51_08470 [Chitinophagaceae bacterium]|nr:hypothetical protein [Chitinophagaceae bacterium]